MSDEENIPQQQEKIVQCYQCGFSASEATYDQTEDYDRLYRWKSIQTNEFEYICSDCVEFVDQDRVVWIAQEKANFLEIGQIVLAQVDNKEGEEEQQINDGWFRAIVWKFDDEKKECEIEFHDKSKGIFTKKYDDIKKLYTFYSDYEGDVSERPLMHYYDNYADYARRHDIFPAFDFVQIEDNQISEELNISINQILEDILVQNNALESKKNQRVSNNDNSKNTDKNHKQDLKNKNQNARVKKNKNQNSRIKKDKKNKNARIKKISKQKKDTIINPWEFCCVRGETLLKSVQSGSTIYQIIDEYYSRNIQYENYQKALNNTKLIQSKSERTKRLKKLKNIPAKCFYPLNYHFFDTRMQITKYQRIATNFFMDKNNQVIIEDFISGLTPRKNFTKFYGDIGKIFQYFVPMFENCLQKIYEKYNIRYSEELRDLSWSEPPEKRQKLMMEQSGLTGRKMQVFVEAVDYKIQAQKKFQGKWKIEGLQQENIVAIGIYCCEISEDLSDFGVEFRRGINQHEIDTLSESYAYEPPPFNTKNAEIILGSVHIKKNRYIAFPNDVQHRITQFSEKNYENVKNCKILYFFLVDPELEIVSSVDIQNQNWEENKVQILMELQKIAKRILGQSFSQEVVEKIVQVAKTGFSRKEELLHRNAAIKTAKIYNKSFNDFTTRSFGDEISDYYY